MLFFAKHSLEFICPQNYQGIVQHRLFFLVAISMQSSRWGHFASSGLAQIMERVIHDMRGWWMFNGNFHVHCFHFILFLAGSFSKQMPMLLKEKWLHIAWMLGHPCRSRCFNPPFFPFSSSSSFAIITIITCSNLILSKQIKKVVCRPITK